MNDYVAISAYICLMIFFAIALGVAIKDVLDK